MRNMYAVRASLVLTGCFITVIITLSSCSATFPRPRSPEPRPTTEARLNVLEAEEESLAKDLKDGSRDDLERDSGLLEKMGDIYAERSTLRKFIGDFVKASALYNAAAMRTKREKITTEIERAMRRNEESFCEMLSGTCEKIPFDYNSQVRRSLNDIRNATSISANALMVKIQRKFTSNLPDDVRLGFEKKYVRQTRRLFEDLRQKIRVFFWSLISTSIQILGPAPQEFAVLGLGSLARGETTTYSDIEWCILVEDESNIDYFRNLVRMVHFFVLNLRETVLKSMQIKSLNDNDKPEGNWFEDKVTPRGFMFDSSAPHACHTPLGRPDRPTRKGIELIRTPRRMAELCEYNTALKEGYDIDRILASVVKIGGSKESDSLVEEFKSNRRKFKNGTKASIKARADMMKMVKRYFTQLSFVGESDVFDIKEGMFRLPTLVISLFKTVYSLNSSTPWDILDEMTTEGIITEDAGHNLQVAVSIVAHLRLVMYSNKSRQNELMSMVPPDFWPRSEKVSFIRECKVLVLRYYCTVIPFVNYILHSSMHNHSIILEDFYTCNHFLEGLIEMQSLDFKKGLKKFKLQLENTMYRDKYDVFDPYTLPWFVQIDAALDMLGYNEFAFDLRSKILLIWSSIGENIIYPLYFASMHNEMAAIFLGNGDIIRALPHINVFLSVMKTLNVDTNMDIYQIMSDLISPVRRNGVVLRYLHRSLDIYSDIMPNEDSSFVAVTLQLIGRKYFDDGNLEAAVKYTEDSLHMNRRLLNGLNSEHVKKKDSFDNKRRWENLDNVLHQEAVNHTNVNYAMQYITLGSNLWTTSCMKLQIQRYIVRDLLTLGRVYNQMGNFNQSLKYWFNAFGKVHYCGTLSTRCRSGIFAGIAKVYRSMNRSGMALHYLYNALISTPSDKELMNEFYLSERKLDHLRSRHKLIEHGLRNVRLYEKVMSKMADAMEARERYVATVSKTDSLADWVHLRPSILKQMDELEQYLNELKQISVKYSERLDLHESLSTLNNAKYLYWGQSFGIRLYLDRTRDLLKQGSDILQRIDDKLNAQGQEAEFLQDLRELRSSIEQTSESLRHITRVISRHQNNATKLPRGKNGGQVKRP